MEIFVIGMAGSGKTTLVSRLQQAYADAFVINLDPAVLDIPYKPDIDIRDAVNYQQLVTENKLGPNGAILTALNLFVTKMDQMLALIPEGRTVIFDAPGQIEAFVWSASGEILMGTFPGAACLYVADGSRMAVPSVFVSSMLYSLAIQNRLKLGKILNVFNKADLLAEPLSPEYKRILEDNERPGSTLIDLVHAFATDSAVLSDCFQTQTEGDYQASFLSQVSLYLDQFWQGNDSIMISAQSGAGIEELHGKIAELVKTNRAHATEAVKARQATIAKEADVQKAKFLKDYDDEKNLDEND